MNAELTVNRDEFVAALKSVARFGRANPKAQAVLTFDGAAFAIEVPGVSAAAAATGQWRGQARVSAHFLVAQAEMPQDTDPFRIRIENGRLYVNTSSIEAVWEEAADDHIWLPMNAPLKMVLSVAYHHTPDAITKSGLTDMVDAAKKERDKRLGKAAEALSEFGVTRAELRAIVDAKMRATERP